MKQYTCTLIKGSNDKNISGSKKKIEAEDRKSQMKK